MDYKKAQTRYMFQFTHPGRGATSLQPLPSACLPVSIHAPREGCDANSNDNNDPNNGFNSRTPGGVRLLSRRSTNGWLSFNSRTPGGVRHLDYDVYDFQKQFQFTHPGRGATALRELFDKAD